MRSNAVTRCHAYWNQMPVPRFNRKKGPRKPCPHGAVAAVWLWECLGTAGADPGICLGRPLPSLLLFSFPPLASPSLRNRASLN